MTIPPMYSGPVLSVPPPERAPKLRPCPFCKATDLSGKLEIRVNVFGWFRGTCLDCRTEGPPARDLSEAARLWNAPPYNQASLRPCPLCGGLAQYVASVTGAAWAECTLCLASGAVADSIPNARECWNNAPPVAFNRKSVAEGSGGNP